MKDFQNAILKNNIEDLVIILDQLKLHQTTSNDFCNHDHTKLLSLMKTAKKLNAPQTPNKLPHLPIPQTISMKHSKAEP